MLPIQLLRAKIRNRGKNIEPIFCRHIADDTEGDSHYALHLSAKLIEEFEESWKSSERNGLLAERLTLLEEQYGDYKLVRGLYTLLQRRCIFGTKKNPAATVEATTSIANIVRHSTTSSNLDTTGHQSIDPFTIRKELFEESSKRGFALAESEKTEIMDTVASKLGISRANLTYEMWSDLDDNLIIQYFFKITPIELIGWYNLSLVQTLLFNCTQLEFSVNGGSNWKRVLRDLKRLGLMYQLEQRQQASREREETEQVDRPHHLRNSLSVIRDDYNYANITCTVNGPLSIFKLTDRYGTAMAKLFPSIISAEGWFVRAWIVRKNLASGKRIYEFEISDNKSPLLLREPMRERTQINSLKKNTVISSTGIASTTYYDSKLEEEFAQRFIQSGSGWSLTREPNPIILSNGRALIPDFMFEKYGKKIYFEIMGFWTREYLEKKLEKIGDILSTDMNNRIDFLIAVSSDHYAIPSNTSSNRAKLPISQLSNFIEKNHLIMYKNESIPLKPILQYLNDTEQKIEQDMAIQFSNALLGELDDVIAASNGLNGVISVEAIAKKYNIPLESALTIINSHARSEEQPEKDESQDQKHHSRYVIVGKHLILNSKANQLKSLLKTLRMFSEASILFAKNGIPEECHVDLISKLGFNIVWKGIDYNTAIIEKKT